MDGKAEQAEPLLKQAMAAGGSHEERVSQNLALVRGLQGKPDEAKVASAHDVGGGDATPIATGAVPKPVEPTKPAAQAKSPAKSGSKAKLASTTDAGEEDKSGWSTHVAVQAKR
jgi:hypothetical protein